MLTTFVVFSVFLFVAVYGLRLSYALMTFGITAVLSLLYVLLGFYTDQILMLRLVETVVGAAFGGAAATLVLPIHTERVVSSVIAEALNRLGAAVEQASLRLTGDEDADPIQAARMQAQIGIALERLADGKAPAPPRAHAPGAHRSLGASLGYGAAGDRVKRFIAAR